VAIGIGDSYYGGRLTYIEAVKRSYSDPAVGEEIRSLTVTGSLGTIIKESMDISYTFARIFLRGLNNTFLY
jgi:ATP-dependent Lon protease